MHAEAFEAEEISVASSDCGAEENDPPDHARNMPFDSGEAAAARLVELVPGLEKLRLDHRFTQVLRLDRSDRTIELTQRLPSLVGYLATPLERPFLVDDDTDVTGYSISDLLSLSLW